MAKPRRTAQERRREAAEKREGVARREAIARGKGRYDLPVEKAAWDQNDWLTSMIRNDIPLESAFYNVSWDMPEELENKHVATCLIHQINGGLDYNTAWLNCKDWAVVPQEITNGNRIIEYLIKGGFTLKEAYERFMGQKLPGWLKNADFRTCVINTVKEGVRYEQAVTNCQSQVENVKATIEKVKRQAAITESQAEQAEDLASQAESQAEDAERTAKKLRKAGLNKQAKQAEDIAEQAKGQAEDARRKAKKSRRKAQEANEQADTASQKLEEGDITGSVQETEEAEESLKEAQSQAEAAEGQSRDAQGKAKRVRSTGIPERPPPERPPTLEPEEEVEPEEEIVEAKIFDKLKAMPKWIWIAGLGGLLFYLQRR